MHDLLNWSVTAAGGIAALVALLSSLRNALRRHLVAESPRGTNALLRTTGPMEDLLRRYGLLVRSAGTEIVVLIDNLERCHAEEFEASAREPGRPFGLVFIDKIFEFALRIPTVPASASASAEGGVAIAISTSTRGRSETPHRSSRGGRTRLRS